MINLHSYRLEIVSQDKKHEGKRFREHNIGGTSTIGVNKREPFEIRFYNDSWQDVQVRLSVDGTDIATGEPASTSSKGKMWIVRARDHMNLKAWPESNSGGARFVFGSEGDSVAVNTHGNTEGIGVIAAAVFVENHKPITINWNSNYHSNYYNPEPSKFVDVSWKTTCSTDFGSTKGVRPASPTRSVRRRTSGARLESFNFVDSCDDSDERAAVGAGEQVAQQITKTAGLVEPKLDTTLQIRYEWWKDLQTKLSPPQYDDSPNPFPADDDGIDLGNTPRRRSSARRFAKKLTKEYHERQRSQYI
jgi:hypothetical protein